MYSCCNHSEVEGEKKRRKGGRGGEEGRQEEEGRRDKIGNEAGATTVLALFRIYPSTHLAVIGPPEHPPHPDTLRGLETQRETCGNPSET